MSDTNNKWSIYIGVYTIHGGSVVRKSACNAGDAGFIPEPGRSPGEGNGNPLQYAYLGNPMGREVLRATQFMWLQKSWTQTSD